MEPNVFCQSPSGEPVVLFKTGFSLLSSFNPSTGFVIDGTTYRCGEAWHQASKAAHFKDWESHKKIMQLRSPKKMKEVGQSIKGCNEDEWVCFCTHIIMRGLRAKMMQNQDARELLLSTKNAVIGESSSFDSFWGTGIDIHSDEAANFKAWPGRNEMGKCLMKIRDELMYYNNL